MFLLGGYTRENTADVSPAAASASQELMSQLRSEVAQVDESLKKKEQELDQIGLGQFCQFRIPDKKCFGANIVFCFYFICIRFTHRCWICNG